MNIYNKHIITVNINGKALANPNLLAVAYFISLLEGKNPAEFAFEENDIILFSLKSVKYLEHRFKD